MTSSPAWAFERETPVHSDSLAALLEAARWAPSFKGLEPWRFLVCDRFKHESSWQAVFDLLAHTEKPWAYNVPVLIVAFADALRADGSPNPRASFDVGAATARLCMEAEDLGLATNTSSDFDANRVRGAFEIPERFVCAAIIAVGQRADLGTLGRDVYRRSFAARRREPLGSRCFEARWGQPFSREMLLRTGA